MSNWLSTYWLSLLFVVIYAAPVIRNAVIGRRRTVNQEDFYIGGRRLGGSAIGFSYFATLCSTNAWVGFAGQAYVIGPVWLSFTVINLLFSYASWRWIAPRLPTQTEQIGSLTLADFIGLRYGSTLLRVTTAVIVVGASVGGRARVHAGGGRTPAHRFCDRAVANDPSDLCCNGTLRPHLRFSSEDHLTPKTLNPAGKAQAVEQSEETGNEPRIG